MVINTLQYDARYTQGQKTSELFTRIIVYQFSPFYDVGYSDCCLVGLYVMYSYTWVSYFGETRYLDLQNSNQDTRMEAESSSESWNAQKSNLKLLDVEGSAPPPPLCLQTYQNLHPVLMPLSSPPYTFIIQTVHVFRSRKGHTGNKKAFD